MSEDELLALCKEPKPKQRLHWTSEVYGFGAVLRKYGFFPGSLPLNIYLSHGLSVSEKPSPYELKNDAPFMLYFSPRLVKEYKKNSDKKCYCVISPNVFYRRYNKIAPDANAKGSLAFLSHTTPMIENKMNLVNYILQLKALPDEFHPISICLHYHDVIKGVYKIFFDYGFEVVTVGNPYHELFIERFYTLIRRFRYTTSNEIGSYTFYCSELGIPFFLYGSEPELYNNGDPSIEAGEYKSYKSTEQYKKVKTLFSTIRKEVTPEQKRFVEEELGIYDSIGRWKMAYILYYAYFIFYCSKIKLKLLKRFGRGVEKSGRIFKTKI
ncbi:hypothetical protein [Chryseolinea sp. H1M3-3]|uniref:hypothetical protein n=1 Tax=Chryseolinea sp. H1M3-3 TaxID=3034144 RepID=UPI0023EB0416|nr:hypothetical protein [Chryseolinea sp. H1M3-3]